MAVRVKIPTILRTHVGGSPEVQGEGGTVRDLLQDLERRYPGITGRYLDGLATTVADRDEVRLLPAMAGGEGRER